MITTATSQPAQSKPPSVPASHTAVVRELDFRTSDGIDVWLLWNQQTNHVSIALDDRHLGTSVLFEVDGADALHAFHHPYAYAPTDA